MMIAWIIAQMGEKVVTFVCIFREYSNKTKKKKKKTTEDTEVISEKFLASNPHP
jgi:hypothetical protein